MHARSHQHFVKAKREIARSPRRISTVNTFKLGQLSLDLLDTATPSRFDRFTATPPLHRAFCGSFDPSVIVFGEQRSERDEILVGEKMEVIGDFLADFPLFVTRKLSQRSNVIGLSLMRELSSQRLHNL